MDEKAQQQLYEYTMIRDEIMSAMKQQHNLSTFSITLTITIISFTFTLENINPYLFLMPLLFLIPAATKTFQLKKDIMTQSAYLAVKLETKDGIYWETALNKYRKINSENRSKIKIFMESCEYCICGIICVLLFVLYTLSFTIFTKSILILFFILFFISIISILYLLYLTNDYLNMDYKRIEKYKSDWTNILNNH